LAIDLNTEVPVPLSDFGKLLPTKVAYRTVFGWYDPGTMNQTTGQRICLETIMLPVGRCTSMEAYHRFIARLNGATP
jgi:hypothetical protein